MKKTEYQFVNSINKMVIATSKNSVFTDTRRKRIPIQAKSKSHVLIMSVASANLAEMSASFGMACMRLNQWRSVKITCLDFVQMVPIVNFNTSEVCFNQAISDFQHWPISHRLRIGLTVRCTWDNQIISRMEARRDWFVTDVDCLGTNQPIVRTRK